MQRNRIYIHFERRMKTEAPRNHAEAPREQTEAPRDHQEAPREYAEVLFATLHWSGHRVGAVPIVQILLTYAHI